MAECRICFEDGVEEQLISPCSCDGSSKWIHESCLQKWRIQTIGRDSALRCEICRTHYLIERINPLETYKVYDGFGICGELSIGALLGWVLGGFLWTFDSVTKFASIKVFQLESLHLFYVIKNDEWLAWSYYQGLCAFSWSSIAFLVLLIKIHLNIKRKSVYYYRIFPKLIWSGFIVISFLFILMIAKLSRDVTVIAYWGPITSMMQVHNLFFYSRCHNRNINKMNVRNIGERILSFQNNPLNYIEARRFEIEDAV